MIYKLKTQIKQSAGPQKDKWIIYNTKKYESYENFEGWWAYHLKENQRQWNFDEFRMIGYRHGTDKWVEIRIFEDGKETFSEI